MDFITSNDEMINRSKLAIEHFSSHVPVIGYYSMIKEYSEDEIKAIFNSSITRKNDKAYIKNLFEKVNKIDYFSYIAIINTLLGEAAGAKITKPIWLNNPDKYYLKFPETKKSSVMVAKFSTDNGISYTEKEYEGDRFSIDDVVDMTYDILSQMGVLSDFKLKGAKAIDFMNAQKMLTPQ